MYAKQIDRSYTGPYAEEIISLADKYAKPELKSSAKNALTMTSAEKENVKEYIYARYDYYDKVNGGYAGDKYTKKIWQETAKKFGISTTDVDMIWGGA